MYDALVVGYGPVGMALAGLLGQYGHRVAVCERYPGLYNLPRAATFDHEAMRTLQKLGCATRLLASVVPWTNYEWCNGAGEVLINQVFSARAASGWAENYAMYQPVLEDALDAAVRLLPNVTILPGWTATALRAQVGGVQLQIQNAKGWVRTLRAKYLIGCDGGNSFVRENCAVPSLDCGFREPWLVFDFRLKRPLDLPLARQICDPAQPAVTVSLGPEYRRWSFMMEPHESVEQATAPENVWWRVFRWATPEDMELVRAVSYTFQSRIAERWRVGNVLLAGDAAHQMPPFLGQGMCSGIRDAANLAWKLDLVLKELAGPALLDTYMLERDPSGGVQCELGFWQSVGGHFIQVGGDRPANAHTVWLRDRGGTYRTWFEQHSCRAVIVRPDFYVYAGLLDVSEVGQSLQRLWAALSDEGTVTESNPQGIQSIEIGMRVLAAVEKAGGPASLTSIAAAAGMAPSKAHRYLVSLGRAGFVTQSGYSGLYDLGNAARRLGVEAMRRMDEVNLAGDYLVRLRDKTGHTVNLTVWGDSGPTLVRWEHGSIPLPIAVRVGSSLPILASSAGRVFLAFLPIVVTQPVLQRQVNEGIAPPYVDEEVRRIASDIRSSGLAVTSQAVIPGLDALAAPVFDAQERLVLVVALLAPRLYANAVARRKASTALIECVSALSHELGYTKQAAI